MEGSISQGVGSASSLQQLLVDFIKQHAGAAATAAKVARNQRMVGDSLVDIGPINGGLKLIL